MKKGVDFIGVGCGALIVNRLNQVLLLKRSESCSGGSAGFWSQPGGAVEYGEFAENAIRRELKEELNVDVELFGNLRFRNDIRTEGTLKHWAIAHCFAKIVSGELRNTEPDKHEDIKWFDLDNLPDKITEYTLENIKDFKKHIGE